MQLTYMYVYTLQRLSTHIQHIKEMQLKYKLSRILHTVCRGRINNIWVSKSSYLSHNFSIQTRPGSMLASQRGCLPLFWTGQLNMQQVDLQRLERFHTTLRRYLPRINVTFSLCRSPFPPVAKSNKPWRKYREIRVQ